MSATCISSCAARTKDLCPQHGDISSERDTGSQIEDLVSNWAQTYGAAPALDSLREALHRETERYGADTRLSDIHFLLNNPLKTVQATDYMASGLNRAQTIGDYLDLAGHQLDVKPQHIKPVRLPAPLTVDELLAVLTHTTAQVDSAFMYLTPPSDNSSWIQSPFSWHT